MKKYYRFTFNIILILILFLSCSCTTLFGMMFSTPNYNAAKADHAEDVSNYADHIVKNCKLPDGTITTVYVFNSVYDQLSWQNVQNTKFNKEKQELFTKYHSELWCPTGPLTPYWRVIYSYREKYGDEATKKMSLNQMPPISYYKAEDLGQLSQYFTSPEVTAQACFEDSTGVYAVSIGNPKYLNKEVVSKEMCKLHKNEFAVETIFIPKELYKDLPEIKLNPAKTSPYNPSSIPDSDYNLTPLASTGNDVYYYDNNLTNKLQWLAVKVACKGVYDMAYTGDFSAKNPKDYYKTSYIKNYLATNDGKASKGTLLFEGICFDYADFAYKELKDNIKEYPNVKNFWMVGTFENSSDIITYKIAESGESSTFKINQTPVVVYAHNHIHAHENAKKHAWFWVQSTDGTMYWVDPTWTDNTGKPVYGIIRGGKEIQLEPDSRYFAK